MARHFLEWQRLEKWGKRPKRHVPHTGVLVIGGDVTKRPGYDTTGKRQNQEVEVVFAEVSGGKKPSFLENFRTALPQHLPIAENEEAKRHDRGILSQNQAVVACPALRANNAFTPLRSVRSAKNYNSPASSFAVRPSTKKRHNWNDLEIVANWSRRTFPAVRRITIRWKLDLILLNPPNHTSSIPAAGVNFATSL
jgi:hypothetical protein